MTIRSKIDIYDIQINKGVVAREWIVVAVYKYLPVLKVYVFSLISCMSARNANIFAYRSLFTFFSIWFKSIGFEIICNDSSSISKYMGI
jgi:hypothetical protein